MTRLLSAALLALLLGAQPLTAAEPRAQLLDAPRPMKPAEALRQRLAGTGVFVIDMDISTGRAKSVKVVQSTGHKSLDRATVQALKKWRFTPGAVRVVRVPITFTENEAGARF